MRPPQGSAVDATCATVAELLAQASCRKLTVTDLPPIPIVLRTRLAHATLQAVADDCGADILHIKGAAVDASLLPAREDSLASASAEERALPRISADADVLVRPAHLKRFLAALKECGWRTLLNFDTGGGADHSTVLWHDELSEADVHRSFPGIRLRPELAFERLWEDRATQVIAHRPCIVPSVDAQRLVLLLHAARNRHGKEGDVRYAWTEATVEEKDRVSALALELHAEVALAAATGRLDEYADRPEYDLWRLWTTSGARKFEFWRARLKASRNQGERIGVVANPLRLKVDVVELQLGRKPTPREVLRSYSSRLRKDLHDIRMLFGRRFANLRTTLPKRHR